MFHEMIRWLNDAPSLNRVLFLPLAVWVYSRVWPKTVKLRAFFPGFHLGVVSCLFIGIGLSLQSRLSVSFTKYASFFN